MSKEKDWSSPTEEREFYSNLDILQARLEQLFLCDTSKISPWADYEWEIGLAARKAYLTHTKDNITIAERNQQIGREVSQAMRERAELFARKRIWDGHHLLTVQYLSLLLEDDSELYKFAGLTPPSKESLPCS